MQQYRVLVVSNEPAVPVESVYPLVRAYFGSRTPLDISFTTVRTAYTVTVGQWGITNAQGDALLGVLGIRPILDKCISEPTSYNAIIFLYDTARVVLPKGDLRNWTHWEPYHGASIIEVATNTAWGTADMYRVITHELIHAFHQTCRLNGHITNDTMDLYDDEFKVESPTGNRSRNILEFAGKWDRVTEQPALVSLILSLKVKLLALTLALMGKATLHKNIYKFADAIKKHEGWFEGSRSHRNNNPGNFRFSSVGYRDIYGTVGKDKDNFAIFQSYEKGYLYLCNFLNNACTGKSTAYPRQMTLNAFFSVYAPDTDHNNPRAYAEFVAKQLGVDPTVSISSLIL